MLVIVVARKVRGKGNGLCCCCCCCCCCCPQLETCTSGSYTITTQAKVAQLDPGVLVRRFGVELYLLSAAQRRISQKTGGSGLRSGLRRPAGRPKSGVSVPGLAFRFQAPGFRFQAPFFSVPGPLFSVPRPCFCSVAAGGRRVLLFFFSSVEIRRIIMEAAKLLL